MKDREKPHPNESEPIRKEAKEEETDTEEVLWRATFHYGLSALSVS